MLNATSINKIYTDTNHIPKTKKQIHPVNPPSELTISIVLSAIKKLKTTTRDALVIFTDLSKSTIDRSLLHLENEGNITRTSRRNGRQQNTTITWVKS